MLETLTPTYAAAALKRTPDLLPASAAAIARQLLPGLIAILIVVSALSVPVLLILWRLRQPYS